MSLTLVFLLLAVFITLFLGVPIAMAIGVSAFFALIFCTDISPLLAIQKLYAGAESGALIAVPVWIIAGEFMSYSGISKRIVRLADALVGHLPGGIGIVCVISSMFFAGISGSAAADTAAVGSILIPAMIKRGYTPAYAGALQAAAGSMGVIIPPSVPVIIFGALTGASVGKLLLFGVIPGILIGSVLILFCVYQAKNFDNVETVFSFTVLKQALSDGFWTLGVPLIIFGGIFSGVFSPTEAGAVVILYILFLGFFIYNELRFKDIFLIMINGSITSGVIMLIICTASMFSWLLTLERGAELLAAAILSLTENPLLLLLLLNLMLLLVGTIVETTAALILFVPVILPLLPHLGISVYHLGIIVVVNLAIGMLTPPLGICLFVSCAISRVGLSEISRAVVPFLAVMIFVLLLISFVPLGF